MSDLTGAQADERADVGPAMFPLMLNITSAPILAIGGAGVVARLAMLAEYGAAAVQVFSAVPPAELKAAAGARLTERWPTQDDFTRIKPRLLFVTDLDDVHAGRLRAWAHEVGAFVHVQDRIPLCDFHLPARLRRGQLQITVSTDGAAPGLSRLVRNYLADVVVGPEWAGRVAEASTARKAWKRQGFSMAELATALEKFVVERGWLKAR